MKTDRIVQSIAGSSGYFFVSIVAAAVFKLSFGNLRELAIHFRSPEADAWLLPIGIDGAIIALSVFAVGRRKKGRDISKIKTTIAGITLASIVCNVSHGLFFDADMMWIGWAGLLDDINHAVLGMFVVAIPPVLLAAMIHFMLADIEAGINADLQRQERREKTAQKVAKVATLLRVPKGARKRDREKAERLKKTLQYYNENPGVSITQIADAMRVSRSTTAQDLIDLGVKEPAGN